MPTLFDLHPHTRRLALWRKDPHGRYRIDLRFLAGQVLGEIAADLLPLGPHWSPGGESLAFFSNDGLLYRYHLGNPRPEAVFSDPTTHAGFCEWLPGGNRLVYSAYTTGQGLPPSIFTLDLDTGDIRQLTDTAQAVDRFPHPSPSGRQVAFRRQFLDEPDLPRWLYVVDLESGAAFPILDPSEGDLDIGRFSWGPDSSTLLVTQLRLPHAAWGQLRAVRLPDQSTLWRYTSETVRSGAFSPQGDRVLCICTDELLWFAYPEGSLLERLPLDGLAPVRITFSGPQVGFHPDGTSVYFLGENDCLYRWQPGGDCECILDASSPPIRPAYTHEEYQVPARDGRLIPVQRFIPPQAIGPAILYVHGGPFGAINPDDPFMLRLLAEGVEFVCAAYRGSVGYGLEHAEANRGEYGRADVWDLLAAGFDWKERAGGDRPLILAGYSYGGFLTFLALAQAEVPWAGGITLYAASGIHRMGLQQPRAFPSEPGALAQAMIERSPMEQAEKIHVPLLIFHGALDTVAATEEVQSIRDSILSQGGDCDLVVFKDDTHGLLRHRDEIHARVVEFLKRFE